MVFTSEFNKKTMPNLQEPKTTPFKIAYAIAASNQTPSSRAYLEYTNHPNNKESHYRCTNIQRQDKEDEDAKENCQQSS